MSNSAIRNNRNEFIAAVEGVFGGLDIPVERRTELVRKLVQSYDQSVRGVADAFMPVSDIFADEPAAGPSPDDHQTDLEAALSGDESQADDGQPSDEDVNPSQREDTGETW